MEKGFPKGIPGARQIGAQPNLIASLTGGAMAKVNPIQVQKFLGGMDYPASKQEIVDHAKSKGADQNVMDVLEQMPEDDYQTPADVSKAIGKIE